MIDLLVWKAPPWAHKSGSLRCKSKQPILFMDLVFNLLYLSIEAMSVSVCFLGSILQNRSIETLSVLQGDTDQDILMGQCSGDPGW